MAEEPPPARGDHKAFTPAERIAELNDVDKSVASLLKSASSAISILANAPSSDSKPTLASQQAAFTSHSDAFFSTLSSIDVRLRRQVYALEEAGLIPPGDERRDAKRGTAFASEEVNRAGNGPLDASWLNARASDGVSKGMEREIWAQARGFVERLKEKKAEGGIEEESKADEGGDMEVDAKDGEDAPAAT